MLPKLAIAGTITLARPVHRVDIGGYVVYVRHGETKAKALVRFFQPHSGETWPVAIMPEPCKIIELERYASQAH